MNRIAILLLIHVFFFSSIEDSSADIDIFGSNDKSTENLKNEIAQNNTFFDQINKFLFPEGFANLKPQSRRNNMDVLFWERINDERYYFPEKYYRQRDSKQFWKTKLEILREPIPDDSSNSSMNSLVYNKKRLLHEQNTLNPRQNRLSELKDEAEIRAAYRKKTFRRWFLGLPYLCNENDVLPQLGWRQSQKCFFDEYSSIDKKLRTFIFNNCIEEDDSFSDATKNAKCLLVFLQEHKVKALDEEDCNKRPWYVVACFFEFISIGHRITSNDPYKKDLLDFFPETPYEFFDWPSIRTNDLQGETYAPKISEAIQSWLEKKFAYPHAELIKEDGSPIELNSLLDILNKEFKAIEPHNRYLRQKYSKARNQQNIVQFLDRFLEDSLF